MRSLKFLLVAILCNIFTLSASAVTTDSEGMPVIYLRGSFGRTSWGVSDSYKFTRTGNVYSLTIDRRNALEKCEFKISDDDWQFNLGMNVEVNSAQLVEGYRNGPNMSTAGMTDAVISFTYNPDASSTTIKFVIDGIDPEEVVDPEPEPLPGDYPTVFLRGNQNGTNWAPNGLYQFKREGNIYTLDITQSNPIPAGAEFKIGDENWNLVDFGAQEKSPIDYTQSVNLVRNGKNLYTVNGILKGSISFAYNEGENNCIVSFTIDGTTPPPVSGMSGTLPVLYINVYADEAHTALNNEVISKDLNHKNYFEFAEYWLDTNGCEWMEELGAKSIGSEKEPLPLQIKARGNWTRIGFSKKPFKLKLDKKQSLLGLSKSKHFALLAHADDNKGYMRNFVGFNLGKRIGLPWTPSQQPVEVVINGNYRGLYFITESIRVEEDRVNIVELDDNVEDGKLVSGGYIVELDNYDEDESSQIRMEEKHFTQTPQHYDMLRITFDTPEVYSDLQRYFITEQFSTMNDCVGTNDNKLWSYLDLDDAARYYLVEEIVSHTESYHGSTYLFRDYGDGQKWHFSPLWDFGNAFNGHTNDFFYNCDPYGNTWIPSMRENKRFNEKVKDTWLWFMSNEYEGLEDDMNEFADRVTAAALADYNRWKDAPVPGGGVAVADNRDMQRKTREVTDHLNSKINWLISQFGDYRKGTYSEPERDATEAAPLPPYVATDIVEIIDNDAIGDDAVYFNLQGMRIDNPAPGNIYIVVSNRKAVKALIR